jgi:3-hydroxyacyl-[acyl-carrier-protein] dehydratase
MRLIENLFHIVKIDVGDNEFTVEAVAKANCDIYKVHFPGHPITPGACLIQMVRELTETVMHKNLRLTQLKGVKFLSVIVPGDTPVFFSAKIKKSEQTEVQASIYTAETLCAKLTLILQ